MKNTIKLLVAAFALAAFACTPSSDKSSNEKKDVSDSTKTEVQSDSVARKQSNDSLSIAK